MKIVKYLSMVNKVSSIEGQKEQLKGQADLTEKHARRGDISEDDSRIRLATYTRELNELEHQKRDAIRHYLAA